MHVAITRQSAIDPDPGLLTPAERDALASVRGERRRSEWICGRLALRRALGDPDTSILVAPDGAPAPVGGAPCSVSLSHDGDWIAVAVGDATARIGIDLCLREHAGRVTRILRWLDVRGADDTLAAWVALEAVLKLRRLPIEALRDRALELRASPDAILVSGLGDPVTAQVRDAPDYVVGWAMEAA